MRFARTLATAAVGFAALAAGVLPATGAFAATTGAPPTGHNQGWQQPGGNNNDHGKPGDPNGNKGGNKGCTDDWNLKGGKGDLQPWGNNNCKPAPKPKPDPRSCAWGWDTSWAPQNGHHTGDLVKHVTWSPESWNSRDNRCEFPVFPVVVYVPPVKHAPNCGCTYKTVVFELPTFGTWLLETKGPKLTDGELLSYQGQTWTVENTDAHGTGSQGPGFYFTLDRGKQELASIGTSKNPAEIQTEFARTLCPGTGHGDHAPVKVSDHGNHGHGNHGLI